MNYSSQIKKHLPKSLLGRSVLILAIPILMIQAIVSSIFVDRLYGDVTIAKSIDLAREVNYILSSPIEIDLRALQARAQPLAITVRPMEHVVPASDQYDFFDISGRYIISTLRSEIANIYAIDLSGDDRAVQIWLTKDETDLFISFSRRRASAVNPHQLLVATGLASFLFITIAVVFLRNQVKPIRQLAKSAEAFGKGDKIPFSPSGAAEVRKAGHALISMQARIERHLQQRTAILSGVSHDLRTPLTRMKLSISLMEENESLNELQGDVDEMERIVNEFLAFTRGDSGEEFALIDPKIFVKSVIRDQRRSNHEVALKFTGLKAEKVELKCRKQAMTRALNNLLSNAARHAENTRLTLFVSVSNVCFIVEDDGPGIPKAERETALQPFERLDSARNQNKGTGTGLGLAIASDIARSHGGQIILAHSTKMGGLRAEIQIPR
jgi:two-component system osmolarity sensor histidine kinase EnvZ